METVMVVWFLSLLFGSGVLIGVAEKQKEEARTVVKEPTAEVFKKDAGSTDWKGNESSSVRTYWDIPKS